MVQFSCYLCIHYRDKTQKRQTIFLNIKITGNKNIYWQTLLLYITTVK